MLFANSRETKTTRRSGVGGHTHINRRADAFLGPLVFSYYTSEGFATLVRTSRSGCVRTSELARKSRIDGRRGRVE